jgi:hypothetical protein
MFKPMLTRNSEAKEKIILCNEKAVNEFAESYNTSMQVYIGGENKGWSKIKDLKEVHNSTKSRTLEEYSEQAEGQTKEFLQPFLSKLSKVCLFF